jgi:hypothetical protein
MDNKLNETYNDAFRDAYRDPALMANINVSNILSSCDDDYLTNLTIEMVHKTTYETLLENGVDRKSVKTICEKLANYRFVDDLRDLHLGKHIRWIKLPITESSSLTNGGIVTEIKFLDGGTYVVCKNNLNKFMQYKIDNAVTFQILSEDEQCILLLNNEL